MDIRGRAGGPTLDRATSEPYSNDNCGKLIAQTCKSISWRLQLFPELRLLLGKVNDEIRQDTNVFPLRRQNVCYEFVCNNLTGGLFAH